MILRIDHIGVAVKALEARLPFWSDTLGLEVRGIETVETEQVKAAMLSIGDATIELLEPTGDQSPIARFLTKRGEGIHHLTLGVSDLGALVDRLGSAGVPILGEGVRAGVGGRKVAFLHPRAAGGVLVELVEQEAVEQPDERELSIGSPVLLYLREPQEKQWGVLRRLDTAGVVLQGIDLSSFDDWVAQIERDEDIVVGASVLFVPMGRVEKILLDCSSGHLPSLAERFLRRTGRTVQDVLGESRGR